MIEDSTARNTIKQSSPHVRFTIDHDKFLNAKLTLLPFPEGMLGFGSMIDRTEICDT
jgi:hypothetical protein